MSIHPCAAVGVQIDEIARGKGKLRPSRVLRQPLRALDHVAVPIEPYEAHRFREFLQT